MRRTRIPAILTKPLLVGMFLLASPSAVGQTAWCAEYMLDREGYGQDLRYARVSVDDLHCGFAAGDARMNPLGRNLH